MIAQVDGEVKLGCPLWDGDPALRGGYRLEWN